MLILNSMRIRRIVLLIIVFVQVGQLFSQVPISNITPKKEAINFTPNITFKWNKYIAESNIGLYNLSVSSDSLFATILLSKNGLINTTDSILLNTEGKYFWKVEYFENGQLVSSSESLPFFYVDLYGLPNFDLLLRADSGVVLSANGTVSRWTNLVDTFNNAIQNTLAQQPSLVQNVTKLNTQSVVRLDGVDDLLQVNSSVSIGDMYVIANWNGTTGVFPSYNGLVAGQNSFWIFSGDGAGGNKTILQPNSLFPNYEVNGVSTLEFAPLNEYKILRASRNSGFPFANLNIGRDRTNATRYWNGDIAEIMIFSSPLSDSLKKIVNAYLCQKYSKPLSLGGDIIADQGFCDTLITTVDTNYVTYLWSNGDTTYFSNLTPGESYTLTVTNEFGCEFIDEISVVVPIARPENQFLCLRDTFLYDTDLSKSDYSFLWNELSTDSFINITQQGDYSVNSCTFSSDTLKVRYDSSLLQYTLGPDTAVCRGNEISLLNGNSTITNYLWSTGNTLPIQQIDTSGIYTLKIGNGKCFASDTINVNVKGDAPVANFLFDDLCFNDSTSFVDTSLPATTSDTIVNWSWKFGNGDSSILQNPKYSYPQRSAYRVSLEIETDKGCSDTISKILEIEPLPIANFGFQNSVICSKSRIFHEDSSSISRGVIASYEWNFGDSSSSQNSSQLRNPFHTYDTLGNYNVKLKVVSVQGCLDSISKLLYINPTPNVDFGFNGNCIADSIQFLDSTIVPSANIRDYRWTILKIGAGSSLTDQRQNPLFKINSSGDYIVTFRVRTEVTTSEFCESIKRDTIQLFDSPIAGFTAPVVCENDSFNVVSDVLSNDSITDFLYVFNQTDTVLAKTPRFSGQQPGNYRLELFIESDKKCTDSTSEFITVHEKPNVDFDVLNNNTGIPFAVDIRNNTVNASSYVWTFGNGDSSSALVPNYIYSDTGTYRLNLQAISDEGCIDSVSQKITALNRFIDAELLKIFLNENNLGDVEVSAQINNSGFNTINEIAMVVDLNNEFEFRETFERKVYSGRSDGFIFGSTFIPDAGKKIDFVCVRILSVNGEQDSIKSNNERCELGFNEEFTLKLFPNPVEEIMQVQYTLPNDGSVSLEIFDGLGRSMKNILISNQEEGFYTLAVDMSFLERGVYYYRFVFGGSQKKGTIVKM